MTPHSDIVVFGVASNGTTKQWDGHATTIGILLRWFADPALGYPQLGFDIYRAQVPDVPPLPFNDLNVPSVQGMPSWNYADIVTLSCVTGLLFTPSSQPGWWNLIVAPTAPVTVAFSSPAWFVTVRTGAGSTNVTAIGLAAGIEARREDLIGSNAAVMWRTRGLDRLELRGDGLVSLVGYHLLGHASSWNRIAHRCLPVINPQYRCAPQPIGSEADEARSRLPSKVAAQWPTRFDSPFRALLPAIRSVAIGSPAPAIPPDPTQPDAKLGGDQRALVDLSALDPHGARILGLAYDDWLNGALDGREYVYKIVGRWLDAPISLELAEGIGLGPAILLREYGIELRSWQGRRRSEIELRFSSPVLNVSIELETTALVEWTAEDGEGGTTSGNVWRSLKSIDLAKVSTIRLISSGIDPPVLRTLRWTPIVERIGLLPGIVAVEPGPPPGPISMTAVVQQAESPSAITTAALDWPIPINSDGSIPEGEPVSYQIGHQQLEHNPAAPEPVPGAPSAGDLLYEGAPIFVPASLAQSPPGGRTLHIDRNGGQGLGSGWWGWWIRGVDLFGRVSEPSAWTLATVSDTAPPPAPLLLQAEWVQRRLPASTVAALGRSSEAQRWLDSSIRDEGLVASWVFGPEQAALRPDVDGFQLFIRQASLPPGAPKNAALEYGDTWPAAIASFGPMAIRADGTLTADPVNDPKLSVTLSAVRQLAPSPSTDPKKKNPPRWACVTDLDLDGASGIFIKGSLIVDAKTYSIVASGDGPRVTLIVEHPDGISPKVAAATIQVPNGALLEITTNLPDLTPGGGLRARSGALVVRDQTSEQRLQVLRASAGVFLCRRGTAKVKKGDAATWYPVWSTALDAAGFGPAASDTTPVAHAQVAVRAVRAIQSSAVQSTPSVPLTVMAVDVTIPTEPDMDPIAFDPAESCTRLASRADWYGKSRFGLSWTAQANRLFTVYRALGDEINRLDRLHLENGGSHMFPSTDWPAGVYADLTRRTRVETELAALDTAHAIGNADARQAAMDAAYDAMTIDTQMLLARQPYAWPAYVALFAEPTEANSYDDSLDGRSHGHWFYRVTSRTRAGIESTPSEPTPPICCPDVVPPAVPLAHMALADEGAVKLRWLASPDADLDHYDIYAAKDPNASGELESMTPVVAHTPQPHVGGVVIEFPIALPAGEWCFWIVAVDKTGNRSAASTMLRGRALRPPPDPPEWVFAERTPPGAPKAIRLTWSHASDPRLACLVERRAAGGALWVAVSPWLPRATYTMLDIPPDVTLGWDYRVRVRDQIGQTASEIPVITLAALP